MLILELNLTYYIYIDTSFDFIYFNSSFLLEMLTFYGWCYGEKGNASAKWLNLLV